MAETKIIGQLLEVLIKKYPQMSRSKIKQMLHNGRILVAGRPQRQFDLPIHEGDTIEIGPAVAMDVQPPSRFLRIVYEDRFLVVIEKQAGILSMATSHLSLCLKTILDNYFERTHQRCRAHVVHRLDRDTSGLMLFAKSRDVLQMFQDDWKGIVYDRRYVAVVRGHFAQAEGTIRSYLKDNKQYFTYSSPVDNGGKLAITHYRVLERGVDNDLVEARLDTGRKNQIRVHFADLGHPVVGDKKYGANGGDDVAYSYPNGTNHKGNETNKSKEVTNKGKEVEHSLQTDANRLCLHAYRLYFVHPVTGEHLHFDTPVPREFQKL